MPLYEYECEACGQRFEVIQKKFSDEPPQACRLCGKGPVTRLASSPAIQFKGAGWYVTDYAGKGKPDATSAEKRSPKSSGEKAGETKAEAKPAETKAETPKSAKKD